MIKTLEKNIISKKDIPEISGKLEINDIKKFYQTNKIKNTIGLEYERLSLDKNTFNCATYENVKKIIETFSKNNNWELVYDDNTIIGAKAQDNTSISLEPGCQLEISLSPKKNIFEIDSSLNKIINSLDKTADNYNVLFLGYGINPKNTINEIPLLNKKRYLIMDKFLPSKNNAKYARHMMRKTAGIQVNIDYKNEVDAYYKLKFLNLIMPFMQGLSSNSPLEENTLFDKKSLRANIWRFVGEDRCNLFYKNIFKNNFFNKNLFEKYIQHVIDVPLIYIERENKNISINGKITFADFIKKGYDKYSASYKDYILHQSICFPDVRLKNYIEIRNHDSSSSEIALALCAFYKGLADEDFKNLLKEFDFLKIDDIENYNINSINYGINYKINDSVEVVDILKKLFNISKKNLSTLDKLYLNPLLDIIETKKTNSDRIIENNIKNTKDLIKFLNK